MQMIEVSKLHSHPRNTEFFEDIKGEKWEDFKKSIVRRGVVEGIVVYEDSVTHVLTVVSGHQRCRACTEIGILEVPCRITHYPDFDSQTGTSREDMILEDLICTNIMQRGIGNVNPMKMAKCIIELERIYGIKNGNNGSEIISEPTKTQANLSEQIGIDERQLRNYKKLNALIPELQELVEEGQLKATTGYKVWAKMSSEEQEKFFNEIGKDKIIALTQKETAIHIKEKQALEESLNNLSKKYIDERNKPKEVQIKTVEIDNTDYTVASKYKTLEAERNRLQTRLGLMTEKAEAYSQDSLDYKKMQEDIICLTEKKDGLGRQIIAMTDISGLVVEIDHLIKGKLAPVRYSKSLTEAKDDEIVLENLTDMVETIEQWCSEMRKYIPNKINYVEVIL